ncbi:alpha/beta-hydrolase [Corynespora cassiicola Philippines]|uniref:Alpha/beta-hydrolase n=1 Tax=Corynespora cassiicola Philippines TaxID=1448308 RepID=A0A2T2N216_CORCC|nr:alpha/beta-hydrolase [Corynespora cassiicola Philippines]
MVAMGSKFTSLGFLAMVNTMLAAAQNLSFGADNFYQSSNVTVRPISFLNHYRWNISGNLFVANDLDLNSTWPAVFVGHPNGAVKEQAANLYAIKLAEQGFVTLSLDQSFWGGSEGEPRNAVLPDAYSEAFSAAVDFLGQQTIVDRERIGGVGICGSGGFLISAAKLDQRIKAIATSSMYDMGAVNRNGLQNSISIEQRKEILATAAQDRWNVLDGGEPRLLAGVPTEINNQSDPISREFFDFYRTSRAQYAPPGVEPNTTTTRTYVDESKFMNFYPFNDIETISPRPLLFITGDQAHSIEFSEDAYARAAEPKEIVRVPGAGHVDLYDRVELIPFAKLSEFFKKELAAK